jgi:phospho-N-acetylmuramoyl-pentapeptide-transferase
MFYHILFPLHQTFSVFNVFRYLTFRTAYAALTALLVSILVGPYVIRMLKRLQVGQVIRQDGPKSHYSKAGTPTMGGLLIIGTMTLATLLWANLTMPYVWVALLTTLAFGAVGFWDDY